MVDWDKLSEKEEKRLLSMLSFLQTLSSEDLEKKIQNSPDSLERELAKNVLGIRKIDKEVWDKVWQKIKKEQKEKKPEKEKTKKKKKKKKERYEIQWKRKY